MKNKKQINKMETKDKYPLAGEIFYIMRQEYEIENDGKKILDTKAYAFITVNIALLTLFLQIIPFQKLQDFFWDAANVEKIVAIVVLIIFGICISTLVKIIGVSLKLMIMESYNLKAKINLKKNI